MVLLILDVSIFLLKDQREEREKERKKERERS